MGVDVDSLWWIGVIMSSMGALFGSLGDNLIKLSYTKEALALENGKEATHLLKRPIWWSGMLCITLLNTSMTLTAYSFADASLTIPFAGLHICFNVGFAKVLNAEVFTLRQIVFTLIILIGVTVVLVAGNHDTVTYSSQEISEFFTNTTFIACTLGLVGVISILVPISLLHYSSRARCFASSALVGTIAAITQVMAKIVSESFTESLNVDSSDVFSHWVVYVGMVMLALSAASQLYVLNWSLSMYNAFVVVPIYNSFLIILGSVYAAILFKEYERFGEMSSWLMPLGILSTSIGVGLLAYDHNPEAKDELILGNTFEPIELGDMRRTQSFPHTPVLDSELGPYRPTTSEADLQYPSARFSKKNRRSTIGANTNPGAFDRMFSLGEDDVEADSDQGSDSEKVNSLTLT